MKIKPIKREIGYRVFRFFQVIFSFFHLDFYQFYLKWQWKKKKLEEEDFIRYNHCESRFNDEIAMDILMNDIPKDKKKIIRKYLRKAENNPKLAWEKFKRSKDNK